MYGLFQTAFYFGYMAVFSLSLGILCGTIGYMGTRWVDLSNLALQRPEICIKTLLLYWSDYDIVDVPGIVAHAIREQKHYLNSRV